MNMKQHRYTFLAGRVVRIRNLACKTRRVWIIAIGVVAGSLVASGQDTNAPARPDYPFFSVIADRNIFNPNRYAHQTRSSRAEESAPQAATFSLVGTMSYQKGTFAFFDGTSPDYRKVLQRDDTIAGYKVTAIAPDTVNLDAKGKEIQMKVGALMRQDKEGGWQLGAQEQEPVDSVKDAASEGSSESVTSGGSEGEMSDVLKKLMQQREQELK
jgi:hypothetical protein